MSNGHREKRVVHGREVDVLICPPGDATQHREAPEDTKRPRQPRRTRRGRRRKRGDIQEKRCPKKTTEKNANEPGRKPVA